MMQTVWIEVPVKDLDRALRFYQTVFQLTPGEATDDGVRRTITLSGDAASPGFSLNQTAGFEPGAQGVLTYLAAGDDLTGHLNRVEAAGGRVMTPKTSMGEMGSYYAIVHDTEGNAFALWSMN